MVGIEAFDEIRDSIINGQKKQAFEQMKKLNGEELARMMDYYTLELYHCQMAVDAAKIYLLLS